MWDPLGLCLRLASQLSVWRLQKHVLAMGANKDLGPQWVGSNMDGWLLACMCHDALSRLHAGMQTLRTSSQLPLAFQQYEQLVPLGCKDLVRRGATHAGNYGKHAQSPMSGASLAANTNCGVL